MRRVEKYHISLADAEASAVDAQLIHGQSISLEYHRALMSAQKKVNQLSPNSKRRKRIMKISEAVDKGFKFFKVKHSKLYAGDKWDDTYFELIDEYRSFNVKNHVTGNILIIRENYEIVPLKNLPSQKQIDKDSGRTDQAKRKISKPVLTSGADIPEKIGKRKSNKTEGPTFKEIIADNIKKIKSKEDIGTVLKANGLELSSSSIRYGWFLRNQIIKGGGDYYGKEARAERRKQRL